MDIKDFKENQSAYIIQMYTGRNTEPKIHETKVEKVGRKYVTVQNGARYESVDNDYCLVENIDWGERSLLCPTIGYAHMYIEREQLRQWFHNALRHMKGYSLEQLREVKRILEGQTS